MNRTILIIVRWALGVLTLMAVVSQILVLDQRGGFNPFNFLSYFTNLSNIFAAVVILGSAWNLIQRQKSTIDDDVARGASVLYIAVSSVVYITILSQYEAGLTLPWVNIQLHYVMPIAMILDWLYQPAKSILTIKHVLSWLIFPALFLVYTLIRGPIVHWYPNPFLNPDMAGYGIVVLRCIGILLIFFVLGWLLITLSNKFKRNV